MALLTSCAFDPADGLRRLQTILPQPRSSSALSTGRAQNLPYAAGIVHAVTHVYDLRSGERSPGRSSVDNAPLLLHGWGFRSQLVQDGARQITELIAPGDFCVIAPRDENPPTHIEACGPARVATLSLELLPDSVRAQVKRAQHRQQADLIQRLRARLVSLGRRDARERLAHLMAETHARLAAIGFARANRFDWPFTQEHTADMLGLTPVHTNRILGRLRDESVLVIRNRQVMILDLLELHRIGGFESPHTLSEGATDELL